MASRRLDAVEDVIVHDSHKNVPTANGNPDVNIVLEVSPDLDEGGFVGLLEDSEKIEDSDSDEAAYQSSISQVLVA
ncbi:hypothetical protein AAHA92_28349 [Salvia divinorum]|uniref:Uncharacterized protein n=1 Tax=Salvia divinorum TaxID=28513 RepID=A0ABD1FUT2_SALDI